MNPHDSHMYFTRGKASEWEVVMVPPRGVRFVTQVGERATKLQKLLFERVEFRGSRRFGWDARVDEQFPGVSGPFSTCISPVSTLLGDGFGPNPCGARVCPKGGW